MDVQNIFLLLTVTAAASVEMVEAVTIIVAGGISRSWRSSLYGAGLAILTLAALVVIFGPALITRIPLDKLRILIGVLLLLMGLQWLRKSILRSAGYIALRNEAALFQKAVKVAETGGAVKGFDGVSFTMSYKGVFLEGLEVVFIVISFGAVTQQWALATAGAGLAAIVIGGIGIVMAKPLAKVPENLLKKSVGLMLVSFGAFWLGEGAGIDWPTIGEVPPDVLIIPSLAVFFILLTQALIAQLSRSKAKAAAMVKAKS